MGGSAVKIIASLLSLALVLGAPSAASAATQTVTLAPGFVFSALAVAPTAPLRSSDLFAASDAVEQVFAFEETTFVYQLRLPSGTLFGASFEIAPGKGFILKCSPQAAGVIGFSGLAARAAARAELSSGRFSFRGFPALASRPDARTLLLGHDGLASIFRWNPVLQSFDFMLKLPDGTPFGSSFELREEEGYFLNRVAGVVSPVVEFGAAPPLVPEFRLIDPTSTAAALLFFTAEPCVASAESASAGDAGYTPARVIVTGDRTHHFRFEGLAASTSYQARVTLRASAAGPVASVEPAVPLPFRTVAAADPAIPVSAYGRVVDASGAPVSGAYAVVSLPGRSTAVSAVTNTIGVFLVALTNLRDAATGEAIDAGAGDEVETDVLAPGRSALDRRTLLVYDEEGRIFIGQFTLP